MKRDEILQQTLGFDDDTDFVVLPRKVFEYIKSGRAGASAEAMLEHLMGVDITGGGGDRHPEDSGDLIHCIWMFRHFPELRPYLGQMADVSSEWAALVAHWDVLEDAYAHRHRVGGTNPVAVLLEEILESVK